MCVSQSTVIGKKYTNKILDPIRLPSVAVPLEMEPQLENVVVELTSETALVGILPLSIHDLKCYVLVWWTGVET